MTAASGGGGVRRGQFSTTFNPSVTLLRGAEIMAGTKAMSREVGLARRPDRPGASAAQLGGFVAFKCFPGGSDCCSSRNLKAANFAGAEAHEKCVRPLTHRFWIDNVGGLAVHKPQSCNQRGLDRGARLPLNVRSGR